MSTYKYEYRVTCRNDCRMEGCPTHLVQIAANNTSDTLVYYNDGKIDFGMDFDELAEFIKHVHEMRGWVEIDNLFAELEEEALKEARVDELKAIEVTSEVVDGKIVAKATSYAGNSWDGEPIERRIESLSEGGDEV